MLKTNCQFKSLPKGLLNLFAKMDFIGSLLLTIGVGTQSGELQRFSRKSVCTPKKWDFKKFCIIPSPSHKSTSNAIFTPLNQKSVTAKMFSMFDMISPESKKFCWEGCNRLNTRLLRLRYSSDCIFRWNVIRQTTAICIHNGVVTKSCLHWRAWKRDKSVLIAL